MALTEPEDQADGEQGTEDKGIREGLAEVDLDAPDEVHDGKDAGKIDELVQAQPVTSLKGSLRSRWTRLGYSGCCPIWSRMPSFTPIPGGG